MSDSSETSIVTLDSAPPYKVVRNDGALVNAFNAMGNNSTGLGTSRDKSTHTVIGRVTKLTLDDRCNLVEASGIAQRAVFEYPESSGDAGWEWQFAGASKKGLTSKMVAYCDRLAVSENFVDACIEARWHGDGYILIGLADGLELTEPVDMKRIKSIEWLKVLHAHEVRPSPGQFHKKKPESYLVTGGNYGSTFGTVHSSRIIRFAGRQLLGYSLQRQGGNNDSVLQTLVDALAKHDQAVSASSAMMADYSVFKYKLKGLAKLVQDGNTDALLSRFVSIQMGMSVAKGLMMDAENEDADFVNRSYAGVKDIIDTLTEKLVSASDMPRAKLLGTNTSTGLGSADKGESDRIAWELARHKWQERNWKNPLLRLANLIMAAKDGPTRGQAKKCEIVFPSGIEPNKLDEAKARLTNMQEFQIALNLGSLHPDEIRSSVYGGAEFNGNISLLADDITSLREIEPKEAKRDPKTGKSKAEKALEKTPEESDDESDDEGKGKSDREDGFRGDAIDWDNFATVTQKDLDKARSEWESNPPDRAYDGILGAG
jgi:phage-related protein (TIGR01555 family)